MTARLMTMAKKRAAGGGAYNPLTAITWHSAFWADDPAWSNPGDGNAVSSWRNGGTLGTAATQATGTKQPIFRSSVATLNNKAALQFDITDDDLTTGAFTALPMPFSVVVVGNLGRTSGNSILFFLRSASVSPWTGGGVDSGSAWRIYSGGNVNTPYAGWTTPVAFLARFQSGAARVDVNNLTHSAGVGISGDAETVYFNTEAGVGVPGGGHRAFFGLYAGDIFAHAGLADLEGWITDYYGITV